MRTESGTGPLESGPLGAVHLSRHQWPSSQKWPGGRTPRPENKRIQGYLAHKKHPPHSILQYVYTWGHMVVLGGGGYDVRGTPGSGRGETLRPENKLVNEGVPRSYPFEDPTVELYLGSYGGPREGGGVL